MQQSLVAAASAFALLTAVAPVAEAQGVTVRQGERIRIGNASQCTLAYLEADVRTGYTAAHCAQAGSVVYAESGGQWQRVGYSWPSGRYSSASTGNDWAAIRFDDHVTLAGNPLSGDGRVSIDELRDGDRLCFAGAATPAAACGQFIGRLGGNVYWENTGARPGDSGAPVWREGGGFVGVLAGQNIVYTPGAERVALRASITETADAPSAEEEMRLIASFYGERGSKTIQVKSPTVVPRDSGATATNGGSSDPETIAIVLLAITVVLGLALPGIAQAAQIHLSL